MGGRPGVMQDCTERQPRARAGEGRGAAPGGSLYPTHRSAFHALCSQTSEASGQRAGAHARFPGSSGFAVSGAAMHRSNTFPTHCSARLGSNMTAVERVACAATQERLK